MEIPLGYVGGVPESAKTDKVSTDVGRVAWRLVGSPQAPRPTTTETVASKTRRAFIQYETGKRPEGLLSIIPRNL
jgi:hypothetical protein